MATQTIEIAYTVTRIHRCDRCGLEAETGSRTPLPNLWIRMVQRHGKERAVLACSWGCASQLAVSRAHGGHS
jgi:hypothetical protein